MYRVTIDFNSEGDARAAVDSLKDKGGKSILSFAASLGIVHLEEELESEGAKIKVEGAGVHQCDSGDCEQCRYLSHYSISRMVEAGIYSDSFFSND